jgi:site-specific DNA recombinase
MTNEHRPIRYVLYARKSSEAEDRQVQSTEDQQVRLREIAHLRGISIIRELTEAKSAKKPGDRPVFEALLKSVEAGEFDGIICWSKLASCARSLPPIVSTSRMTMLCC